jgi:hypothetical protein
MPRPSPLGLINIPQIEREQPLSQMHDFAGLLGFSGLSKDVVKNLAHCIALARETLSAVAGLTRQRISAELKRCAKKLRREQQTGQANTELRRLLADERLGLDTESFSRLAPLWAAPASELLAAVEARQREVDRLPRVSPQRQALESASCVALWFFQVYAADTIRDEPDAWWHFVRAFLDAAGFPTEMLYQHPESLKPLLARLRPQSEELLARVKPELDELLTARDAEQAN